MQWQFPKCIESGNVELILDGEGNAAGLKFIYEALEDPNAASDAERFGMVVAQTAAALP
jgi:hypothetical protein